MSAIARLLALASVLYLIIVFLFPFWKPVSGKQKKKTKQYKKARQKELLKQKKDEISQNFIMKYGKFLMTESQRLRVRNILSRLDMEKAPEEVRIKQILFAAIGVGVTILGFLLNPLFGYVSILWTFLLFAVPMDELDKKIKLKMKNIELDFPAFYSMVYYQYSKTIHIFLADVIKDYLPNANKDMASELNVMLDNIEYGEFYALKQFKKRTPIHYVIKFCDIMEARLNGYDNTAQMLHLKNEIDTFRLRTLEDELEKRQARNGRLQLVLIVVLAVIVVVYFVFTTLSAMKMFM